ncbi:hypothetical protein G9A89_023387 [Geosiphon pyriformis]|nr:hypothetical protein G9A89_023387 [Geosiphon pyriformis]
MNHFFSNSPQKRLIDLILLTHAAKIFASQFLTLQRKNADLFLKTSNWQWSIRPTEIHNQDQDSIEKSTENDFKNEAFKDPISLDRKNLTLNKNNDPVIPSSALNEAMNFNLNHQAKIISTERGPFISKFPAKEFEKDFDEDITSKSQPKLILKESKVPASRINRLFQYSGLAVGLGIGTISEAARRIVRKDRTLDESKGSLLMSEANIERLVKKLSQMRGAALKIGQMISIQDNKMLPEPLEQVLLRVQNSANYMPKWQMEKVMVKELGPEWRQNFLSFDDIPIAAASIGQVHSANVKINGIPVAVKVQYPGVAASIDSDLDNLRALITFSNLLPKGLYLENTIKVARRELAWETDYLREGRCMEKFGQLLKDDQNFAVPMLVKGLTTTMVLTSELMNGESMTVTTRKYNQETRDRISENILRLCLRELFEFRFMQTDPNWTNFFYNSKTRKIELLDFGASREFDPKFVELYRETLIAAFKQDRAGCLNYSQKLGYLTGLETEVMKSAHVDSIMALAEPFGSKLYDFSKQTVTHRVRELIPTMLRYRLTPPPDETYSLHRKLSGAFLLCAKMGARVRCRDIFEELVLR